MLVSFCFRLRSKAVPLRGQVSWPLWVLVSQCLTILVVQRAWAEWPSWRLERLERRVCPIPTLYEHRIYIAVGTTEKVLSSTPSVYGSISLILFTTELSRAKRLSPAPFLILSLLPAFSRFPCPPFSPNSFQIPLKAIFLTHEVLILQMS